MSDRYTATAILTYAQCGNRQFCSTYVSLYFMNKKKLMPMCQTIPQKYVHSVLTTVYPVTDYTTQQRQPSRFTLLYVKYQKKTVR